MLKHPFQSPDEQLLDAGDGPVRQTAPLPPGPLAVVLTVTTVTGGQRITFREMTSTSRTNATPIAADNPLLGEAMVPTALGAVAVNDLVTTFPLPGRDELVAVPAGDGAGSDFSTALSGSHSIQHPPAPPTLIGSHAVTVAGRYQIVLAASFTLSVVAPGVPIFAPLTLNLVSPSGSLGVVYFSLPSPVIGPSFYENASGTIVAYQDLQAGDVVTAIFGQTADVFLGSGQAIVRGGTLSGHIV